MQPSDDLDFEQQDAFLRRLARGMLEDPHDRDEITQQIWLDVLSKNGGGASKPRSWFSRAVRNKSIDLIRKRVARLRHEREVAGLSRDRRDQEPSWAHEALARFAAELGEPYRSTIRMRFYDGLPPREIARITGVPIDTVRTHLQRGLVSLRAEFDRKVGRNQWTSALVALLLVRDRAVPPGPLRPLEPAVPRGTATGGSRAAAWLVPMTCVGLATCWLFTASLSSLDADDVPLAVRATRLEQPNVITLDSAERRAVGEPGLDAVQSVPGSTRLVRIRGHVIAANGLPAAGVELEVTTDWLQESRSEPAVGRVVGRTSADGSFDVAGVAWPCALVARSGSRVSDETFGVECPEVETLDAVRLRLVPSRTIRGTVRGERGEPAAGVLLSSTNRPRFHERSSARHSGTFYFRQTYAQALSDEKGSFELPGLAPNLYRMSAVLAGHSRVLAAAPLGMEHVDIALRRAVSVRVRVLDSRGDPLPGARVIPAAVPGYLQPQVRSEESGSLEIGGLSAGSWLCLRVEAAGYAGQRVSPIEVSSDHEPVDIVLSPVRSLQVEVRALGGTFVHGALLELRSLEVSMPPGIGDPQLLGAVERTQTVRRNIEVPDGAVTLEAVPGGRLEVIARHSLFGEARAPVGPEAGHVVLTFCPPTEPARLHGHVSGPGGEPLRSEARVSARAEAQFSSALDTGVTSAGIYRLAIPPDETWDVLVYATGYSPRVARMGPVLDSAEWNVRLAPATNTNLRMLQADGSPLAGAHVYLTRPDGAPVFTRLADGLCRNCVRLNERGCARLVGVPREELDLVVYPPGLRPVVREVVDFSEDTKEHTVVVDDFDSSEPATIVSFHLRRGGAEPTLSFEGDYRAEIHDADGLLLRSWTGRVHAGRTIIAPDVRTLYLNASDRGRFRVWDGWEGRYDAYNADGNWVSAAEVTFRVPLPSAPCRLRIHSEGFEPLEQWIEPLRDGLDAAVPLLLEPAG